MNNVRLSPEQQQEVCEDLLCIAQARRLEELVLLRRQMLSECRPPSALQWVDADFIARQASTLIGGTPGYWRDAAAAALGLSSRVESSIFIPVATAAGSAPKALQKGGVTSNL